MELSDFTFIDGPPPGGTEVGMVVRYLVCGKDEYDVVGYVWPRGERVSAGSCGCCAENRQVTGWCWFRKGAIPVSNESVDDIQSRIQTLVVDMVLMHGNYGEREYWRDKVRALLVSPATIPRADNHP